MGDWHDTLLIPDPGTGCDDTVPIASQKVPDGPRGSHHQMPLELVLKPVPVLVPMTCNL